MTFGRPFHRRYTSDARSIPRGGAVQYINADFRFETPKLTLN